MSSLSQQSPAGVEDIIAAEDTRVEMNQIVRQFAHSRSAAGAPIEAEHGADEVAAFFALSALSRGKVFAPEVPPIFSNGSVAVAADQTEFAFAESRAAAQARFGPARDAFGDGKVERTFQRERE